MRARVPRPGRTQFEAYLSLQAVSADGLVSEEPAKRRLTVRTVHNAPSMVGELLTAMWSQKSVEEAHAVLAQPDVTVTNQADKEAMLPKLRQLSDQVRKTFRAAHGISEEAVDLSA